MRRIVNALLFAIGFVLPALVAIADAQFTDSPFMDADSARSYVRFYVLLGGLLGAALFGVALTLRNAVCRWYEALLAGLITSAICILGAKTFGIWTAVVVVLAMPLGCAWFIGRRGLTLRSTGRAGQ